MEHAPPKYPTQLDKFPQPQLEMAFTRRTKQEAPLLLSLDQESPGRPRSLSRYCFGDMDEASASSLVRELYRLPPSIPIEETFARSLPRQWFEFQRSGPPIKIGWIFEGIFLHTKTAPPPRIMREAFASGRAIAEYVDGPGGGGKRMILDFLRKVLIVLDDKGVPKKMCAFYWVDAYGFLFSPTLFGDVDEHAVRRAFDGSSRGSLAITAVRRCHHREARTLGFLERMKFQQKWLFGWYGAAAADVEAAADGGDLSMNWPLLGAGRAHGRGLHVSSQERLIY
uniref:Uncharacterized protein n=1 Tax=Setaria italica TaxID=4555 RepID=K3XRB4_SETIT